MATGTNGRRTPGRRATIYRPALLCLALLCLLMTSAGWLTAATTGAAQDAADPRVGLAAGWHDAASAISNLELLASIPKGVGFVNPDSAFGAGYTNSDIAFTASFAIQGNYRGFQIYDIEDPANPTLRVAVVCPGGQGDPSVYGNLLFISVQDRSARTDCGTQGVADSISAERFRGVRIFDISDIRSPRQVAAVQTCRGSHTHTVVEDPRDDDNVYIYVQGTSGVRPREELAGCSELGAEDPNTSFFRIEVIRVPLARPQDAAVVSEPRIFTNEQTGDIAGLWGGGDHGPGTQSTRGTDRCHDITAYPAIGLAAGACSGNGILLDISDPVNPYRIDEVVDPGFAYWHSATFSNDGTKVIFTDEWGGGGQPRCQASDPPTWGADAIFEIVGRKLLFAGYYKLSAPQTAEENCVAHNGSLIPVPGRDIKVQAWYQGGLSAFDFTDPANPVEIAYFDRGPISNDEMVSGGYWSTYYYNGFIYGGELSRGFDVFRLIPSEYLSQNEIDAAAQVRMDEFNVQHQPRIVWEPTVVVARAYLDQLMRNNAIRADRAVSVAGALDRIERVGSGVERAGALAQLEQTAFDLESDSRVSDSGERPTDRSRLRSLAASLRGLAGSMR
jgi:hypothetical protein